MAAHSMRLPRRGAVPAADTSTGPGVAGRPVASANGFSTPRVGRLVALDDEARPLVSFADGPDQPVVARVATAEPCPTDNALHARPAVLLVFENGDPRQPVIVGFVREGFAPVPESQQLALTTERGRSMELNGRVLIFEGQEEIVLRCGQGSITLRADGQIVLKGTRLTSRASQTNKIRGASVQIN